MKKFLDKNFLVIGILILILVVSGVLIYKSSSNGGGDSNGLSVENLKLIARTIGVNGEEFDACIDSDTHASDVSDDANYGESLGINGTPSFFVNGTLVVGAIPFNQLSSVIDKALAGNIGPVSVDIGDSPVLGDSNAPVTIVEFSDYECPFCGKFFSETSPILRSTYIDTGKVKLVYKDFPITRAHPYAQKAAEAARCVRDQLKDDGYWKMHDKMFSVAS